MCKVQWVANDHPGVNRKPFTEGEYEKLVAAVEAVQDASQEDLFDEAPINWQAVADMVGVSLVLLGQRTYTEAFPEWANRRRLFQSVQKRRCTEDSASQVDGSDGQRACRGSEEVWHE